LRQFARGYVRGYLILQFCKFEAIRGGPTAGSLGRLAGRLASPDWRLAQQGGAGGRLLLRRLTPAAGAAVWGRGDCLPAGGWPAETPAVNEHSQPLSAPGTGAERAPPALRPGCPLHAPGYGGGWGAAGMQVRGAAAHAIGYRRWAREVPPP
jgi:hypothetical protein